MIVFVLYRNQGVLTSMFFAKTIFSSEASKAWDEQNAQNIAILNRNAGEGQK
jgi:hypothetical protein